MLSRSEDVARRLPVLTEHAACLACISVMQHGRNRCTCCRNEDVQHAKNTIEARECCAQVLRFHGPGRIRAGLFDKTILELQADTGSPWDVKCFMAHIVVSVSSGREEPAHDRIVVAASESGAQLKVIMSPVLRIPNALALDWRTSIEFPVRRRQTNSRIGNLTL